MFCNFLYRAIIVVFSASWVMSKDNFCQPTKGVRFQWVGKDG